MKRTARITLCLMSIFLLASMGMANASSWTLTNYIDSGGDAYVVEPSTIVTGANFDLYGSNNYWYKHIISLYHTVLTESATYKVSWYYDEAGLWGGYFWDPAGYYVNGNYTELTDTTPNGPTTQSGTFTISLHANDDVGFYVETYDNWYGRGRLTIAAARVPEPATILLLGLGLMGIAGIRKKIKK